MALGLIGVGIFLLLNEQGAFDVSATPTAIAATATATAEPATPAVTTDTDSPDDPDGVTGLPGEFELDVAGTAPFVAKVAAEQFTLPAPAGSTFASDVYLIEHDGRTPEGTATLLIPGTVADRATIDMVGYDGESWLFIPTDVRGNLLVAKTGILPQALALVQSDNEEAAMTFAAESSPAQPLPEAVSSLFTELSTGVLKPESDGSLVGDVETTDLPVRANYLRISNQGVVADSTTILNFMINPDVRAAHIAAVVEQTVEQKFDGVHVDYQGISDDVRTNYTNFLRELHTALADEKLELAVTLGYPRLSGGLWDSGGQDWGAIGTFADVIYAQMPLDPTLYTDNGAAEQFLAWATRQVNRRDMMLLYTANAVDQISVSYDEVSNEDAIANFGELQLTRGDVTAEGGDRLVVTLDGTAADLAWDGIGATYKFTYQSQGQAHTVWLGNEGSLAYRMRLAQRFGVRGILLRGLTELTSTTGYLAALESAAGLVDPPPASAAAILWSVINENGNVIASSASSDLRYTWEAVDETGTFVIAADFILGEETVPIDSLAISVAGSATATPRPTRVPTATPEPDPITGTINARARLRRNPGTQSTVLLVLDEGDLFEVLEVDSTGEWIRIQPEDQTLNGWVFASLLTLDQPLEAEPEEAFESVGTGTLLDRATLRLRPGSQYRNMGVLVANTPLLIAAIDSSEAWLRVRSDDASQTVDPGWVPVALVSISSEFELSDLPVEE